MKMSRIALVIPGESWCVGWGWPHLDLITGVSVMGGSGVIGSHGFDRFEGLPVIHNRVV